MQTKYDLYVIKQLINFANYLCKRYKFEGIDFRKFNEHFQNSLVKELDFKSEVVNAERTRQLFKEYPHLHIPKNNLLLSSRRTIVMEYI